MGLDVSGNQNLQFMLQFSVCICRCHELLHCTREGNHTFEKKLFNPCFGCNILVVFFLTLVFWEAESLHFMVKEGQVLYKCCLSFSNFFFNFIYPNQLG